MRKVVGSNPDNSLYRTRVYFCRKTLIEKGDWFQLKKGDWFSIEKRRRIEAIWSNDNNAKPGTTTMRNEAKKELFESIFFKVVAPSTEYCNI